MACAVNVKGQHFNPHSAFAHPLWLGALGVLLLNDHLLKGSGWLPGSITGKLSDFAGLIVAPAVLSALMGVRSQRGVFACAWSVLLAFVLIKLHQPWADLVADLIRHVSPASRIRADPTDLMAVPMLLLGVRVQRAGPGLHLLLRYTAFAAGLLACMATTMEHKLAASAVVNHRAFPLKVRIRQAEIIDCETFNASPGLALTSGDFGDSALQEVEPQGWVTLAGACGAAWVTMPDVYDGVIIWHDLKPHYPATEITQWLLDRSLVIEGSRSVIKVTAGPHVLELPPPAPGEPTLSRPDAG